MSDQNEKLVEYIFDILEKTEVSITDFSKVTDISRTSLYRWKDGKNITDMFRLRFAYQNALRMSKAHQQGKFPLKNKLKKDQRVQEIRRIIRTTSPN